MFLFLNSKLNCMFSNATNSLTVNTHTHNDFNAFITLCDFTLLTIR